jgi:hypothetical protein
VNVVSLPLAASVSRAVGGQRPRSDFEGELQRAYEATARESERRLGREFLEHAGRSDWWEIEKQPETRARVAAALEPVWREYAAQWGSDLIAREAYWESGSRRQDETVAWLSALSPGLAFRRLSSDVSGTGAVNAFSWHEAVVTYQAGLYNTLFGDRSRLTLQVPTDSSYALMTFQRRSDPTLAELPVYSAPRQTRARLFSWDFLVLPAQCAVLLVMAVVLFARAGRT